MNTASPFFWWLCGIGFVVVGAAFAVLLLGAERVGSLQCPCRVKLSMMDTRLTVAREGRKAGPPTVQLRVRIPMYFVAHRIPPDEAKQLATLLDAAATKLRAP